MRKLSIIAAITVLAYAQSSGEVEALLSKLRDPSWNERRAAFSRIVARPNLLNDASVQDALIRLREMENTQLISENPYYDDYSGEVLMTVLHVSSLINSGRGYEALLNAGFNATSRFGEALARDPKAFPWILDGAARGLGNLAYNSVGVLAEAARDIKGQGPRGKSSRNSDYESARQVLRVRAQTIDVSDDEISVRLAAVEGLGVVADPDDLKLLQSLATGGVAHTEDATDSLRKMAATALRAMMGGR